MCGPHYCGVVQPDILQAVAANSDPEIAKFGTQTLNIAKSIHQRRHDFFAAKIHGLLPPHTHHPDSRPHFESIVPDDLLEHVSHAKGLGKDVRDSAQKTLDTAKMIREERHIASLPEGEGLAAREGFAGPSASKVAASDPSVGHQREMCDMTGITGANEDQLVMKLPGKTVRKEGQAATQDKAASEAYDNTGKVLDFFKKVYDYNSLNNKEEGMVVKSSVHFGKNYMNAAWLYYEPWGLKQMIYGDGADFLRNFTACLDVIGHELTHAVTQYNSGLVYEDEAGALNEHISDVFGCLVMQYDKKITADKASWLIGEGCLAPGVKGVALRNMLKPGTAYDDPIYKKDDQPASWAEVLAYKANPANATRLQKDHGGVHKFSGVPNRAFALASIQMGGFAWEKTGKVWWTVATTKRIPPRCTFVQFADATVDVAFEIFGEQAAITIRNAWKEVGVVRKF